MSYESKMIKKKSEANVVSVRFIFSEVRPFVDSGAVACVFEEKVVEKDKKRV